MERDFMVTSIKIEPYSRGREFECQVTIKMDAKLWRKTRDKDRLGFLYGVDVSNFVYQVTNQLVDARNPTVRDHNRAIKSVKTITLWYGFTAAAQKTIASMPREDLNQDLRVLLRPRTKISHI